MISTPAPRRARGGNLRAAAKLDAAAVRAQNQRLLLNLIWREHPISRAQLARQTSLSRSAVSVLVGDLINTGLVSTEGQGDSSGGRPPVMLRFNARALLLVGIDLGATHVSVVVTDLLGKVLSYLNQPIDMRNDPDGALALQVRLVDQCLRLTDATASQIAGIGVAVASPIDLTTPGMLSPLLLPAWRGVDLGAHLQQAFDCPVQVDNDANVGALAELWWGAGADGRDLVYIKVATGIGAGHIVNGEIYRGAGGFAGEIGHFALETDGKPCRCGRDGCLGTVAGSDALVARASELLAANGNSPLDPNDLDIDRLIAAAADNDEVACRVMHEAGTHVGRAVASLVNLINPSTVVIGGGLTRAGHAFMGPLRENVRKSALWLALDDAHIVTSQLGEREIAIGAATLILQSALDDPRLFSERLAVGPK